MGGGARGRLPCGVRVPAWHERQSHAQHTHLVVKQTTRPTPPEDNAQPLICRSTYPASRDSNELAVPGRTKMGDLSRLGLLLLAAAALLLCCAPPAAAQCDLPTGGCSCACEGGEVFFSCLPDGDFQAVLVEANPQFAGRPPCALLQCMFSKCIPCQSDADCSWNNRACIAYEQENDCTIRGDKYRCIEGGDCGCGRCYGGGYADDGLGSDVVEGVDYVAGTVDDTSGGSVYPSWKGPWRTTTVAELRAL